MKKNNRKGFTLVELVIVIAVIAILAAVLIPTFTNIVDNANESKAIQESKIVWEEYMVEYADEGKLGEFNGYVKTTESGKDYYFMIVNGQFEAEVLTAAPTGETYSEAKVKTTDTTVVSGKTYYTFASNTYTQVASPTTENIATYYEIFNAKLFQAQ